MQGACVWYTNVTRRINGCWWFLCRTVFWFLFAFQEHASGKSEHLFPDFCLLLFSLYLCVYLFMHLFLCKFSLKGILKWIEMWIEMEAGTRISWLPGDSCLLTPLVASLVYLVPSEFPIQAGKCLCDCQVWAGHCPLTLQNEVPVGGTGTILCSEFSIFSLLHLKLHCYHQTKL